MEQNQIDNVERLLQSGADPNLANLKNMTPIFYALTPNMLSILQLLLQYDADTSLLNQNGESLILIAAASDSYLEELLKVSLDRLDTTTPDGWSPILKALLNSAESAYA